MQFCLKRLLFTCILWIAINQVWAQTVVYSSDSLVKVTSTLSDDILLNESIADSLTIEVNEEEPFILSRWSANEFLLKYKESSKVLDKMRFESEAYCDVVPNCDKIGDPQHHCARGGIAHPTHCLGELQMYTKNPGIE